MDTDKILTVINQITVSKETQEIVKWKPTVSGEQDAFTNALQQNKIVRSTIEQISDVVKFVMLKVGIREKNLPAKEEKQALIDHILCNYGNHTPAEIKVAFDLALAGRLDDRNAKGEPIDLDVVCYFDNFSCIYFSKIMNAYRRWARDNYTQLKKEPLMIAEIEEPEPIETLDMINEWQQRKEIVVDLIPLFFYDFMVTTEMIEVNDDIKWSYWDKAIQAIKTELNMAIPACRTTDALKAFTEFETMYAEKKYTPKMKDRISNKAKKLIVFDYFRKK